jgi:nucleotide-binding universal stress UspA family protein
VLNQAAELAGRFDAELHLASVLDLAQHWALTAPEAASSIIDAQEAETGNLLEKAGQELEQLGIVPHAHLLEGDASEEIAALAGQIGADLIVIGHHHISRLGRMVENSVARSLVSRAPCSVMISLDKKQPSGNSE